MEAVTPEVMAKYLISTFDQFDRDDAIQISDHWNWSNVLPGGEPLHYISTSTRFDAPVRPDGSEVLIDGDSQMPGARVVAVVDASEFFRRMDADGDSKVTQAEAAAAIVLRFDADGDGRISTAERTALGQAVAREGVVQLRHG